jgi:hypothetical protein
MLQCGSAFFKTWFWFLLNVIVPLVSVIVVWGIHRWRNNPMTFSEITADGQSCFYAVALLAASLSEIIPEANPHLSKQFHSSFFWPQLSLIGASLFCYATMNADYHSGQPVLNKTYSSRISFGFVLLAISMSSVVHYCSE